MSWRRRFNVITLPIVPKRIYKSNATSIKILIELFWEQRIIQVLSKVYLENKHESTARKIKIKSYEGGLILPDVTKYYKGTVIEFVLVYLLLGNNGREERVNKCWKYTLKLGYKKVYFISEKGMMCY